MTFPNLLLPRSAVLRLLLAGTACLGFASQAKAQSPVQQFLQNETVTDIRSDQLLGVTSSHCDHVLHLMMKNRQRSTTGRSLGGLHEQLHLPHLSVGLNPGDLEMLCIHLVCDGTSDKGPVFQLSLKNNSTVPIGNFQVSLVGVLGRINVFSPTANACIKRMEAGEVVDLQVQLPAACMSMGPRHQVQPFDSIVVALDSYDQLMECDELNNVAILKRGEIQLLVAPAPVQVAQPQQSPAVVSPLVPVAPSAPVESPDPTLRNIDVDKLEVGNAQSLRHSL